MQEAKAASALNHPNIITIYDICHEDDIDFIVMEYLRGSTLDQLIPRKGLRTADTLKYSIQIADALAAAHAAGIVHRDLKPGNVMVSATRTQRPVTDDGAIVGAVSYMSPKQAEAKKVDARSDIFAFGALMYEMATGQRAFQGDSKMSTLAAVIGKDPKPISELAVDSPRELERLIVQCLRKDPARRFQHMDDIKILLEGLKEDSDSGSLSAPAPPAPVRSSKKRYALASAALIVLVAGAAVAFRLGRPQPAARPAPQSKLTTSPPSRPTASWWPMPPIAPAKAISTSGCGKSPAANRRGSQAIRPMTMSPTSRPMAAASPSVPTATEAGSTSSRHWAARPG